MGARETRTYRWMIDVANTSQILTVVSDVGNFQRERELRREDMLNVQGPDPHIGSGEIVIHAHALASKSSRELVGGQTVSWGSPGLRRLSSLPLVGLLRVAGRHKQAQDLGYNSGSCCDPHLNRGHAQESLDRIRADPHVLRHLFVAESLQQECHGLLLPMGKVKLLCDL